MKLTNWFPGNMTPHRLGVYECDWRDMDWMGGRWFNEWDGKQWRVGCHCPQDHARLTRRARPVDRAIVARALRRWRGVMRVDA